MNNNSLNLQTPLHSIFPQEWKDKMKNTDYAAFRNLDHFKYYVSKLTQKRDSNCGITYASALDNLIKSKADFPKEKQESIRNLVRSNLHKRGLITEEVYENYRYTVDGTAVGFDVGKYANGEPDCVITPSVQYIDFFYELYISISYPYSITNEDIQKNIAKLLATIEELERQHIFIKIVLILPINNITENRDKKFFSSIPLFSHKDIKSVDNMSSVLNDKLLRKFYFAIVEDIYGENLASGYGNPISLSGCMNVGNKFNEIEFFENVVKTVGA